VRPPALRRAIDATLHDAHLDPADIDVVFADASGVPELDRAEVSALVAVFGPEAVPVTAPASAGLTSIRSPTCRCASSSPNRPARQIRPQ